MAKVEAVGQLTAAEKEKKGQRKTDNRNYQHDNRQASGDGAVPNNANHYERWEKHVSEAITAKGIVISSFASVTRRLVHP